MGILYMKVNVIEKMEDVFEVEIDTLLQTISFRCNGENLLLISSTLENAYQNANPTQEMIDNEMAYDDHKNKWST